MTSFWDNNLKALKQYQPALFDLVSGHDWRPVGEVVDTPAEIPTLRFSAQDGKQEVLAYGLRDPWQDAAVHLQTVAADSRGLAVFVGMGLGYGPLLLLRERPKLGMMVIVEPSLDLLITALRHVDLRPLLVSDKVRWLVGDIDLAVLEQMVGRIASLEDTHILRHVPSFQWRDAVYPDLNQQIFLVINQLNAAGGTTRKAGELFFRNCLANLSLLRHSHNLAAVKNLFAGKPVVLVAAGPSLDRSIAELKQVADRCLVFAVDSALAPLLKAGITPDFVTTIDFQDLNFEKLAPFVSGRYDFSLVATNKVTPLIPKRLPARHLFLSFSEDIPQKWIYEALGHQDLTPFAFSVAHLSLGVALLMGCDPIIFVGQDLGYTTTEADHAEGTIIMQRQGAPTDREIFQVPGIDGRPVTTHRGMMVLQKRFEDIIAANPGRKYFNATAAGAHIQGTEPAGLAELMSLYMPGSLPVREMLDRAVAEYPPWPVTDLLSKSKIMLREFKKIEDKLGKLNSLAGYARREIKKLQQKRVPLHGIDSLPAALVKKLAEFDRINQRIDGNQEANGVVLELTYAALSENDRRREENEAIRQQGYLPWLLSEIERIAMVNQERAKAFALGCELLGRLCRHLELEEASLARLATAPKVKEFQTLARSYIDMGDFQLARGMIEQALALEPDSVEGRLLAGEICLALLDFDQADRVWREMLRQAPEQTATVQALRRRQVECWLELADQHANVGEGRGNFPQLLPIWLTRVAAILAHEEEPPEALQRLWQKHLGRMEEWLALGETDNVKLVLRGWECFGDRFPELLVLQARYAVATGETESAIEKLEAAIARDEGQPSWLALLARLLLEAGRFDEGLARLRQAVALDPATATLWEELGDTLLAEQDYANALSAFEQCYRALPERLESLIKMGDCSLASGQPEGAEAAYQAVLARRPADEFAKHRLIQARALAARLRKKS